MTRLRRIVVLAFVVVGLVALRLTVGQDAYIQVMTTAAAVLCWVYVARYGTRSPWWKNQVGRSIMWLALSLAVVLTLICTSFIFGDYPGRAVVRTVVYSSLPVALAEFVRVLVQVQRGRQRGEIPTKVGGTL